MNRFAFVSFWRSLTRHKLYATLNIGGLALGIAVFLVLSLYVRFETGFERWLPDYRQLYIIEQEGKDGSAESRMEHIPMAVWTAIHADLPEYEGTRITDYKVAVIRNGVGTSESLTLADPHFFSVLRLPVVAGTAPTSFSDPTAIVITQRIARKYFSTTNPIGAPLSIAFGGVRHAYHIVAVVADRPDDTEFNFDLIAPLVITDDKADPYYRSEHLWNYYDLQTIVRLPDDAARARLEAALPGIVRRHYDAESQGGTITLPTLLPRPLAGLHFQKPGSILMVTTLGLIGLLTLIVAVVNYVNLAVARSGLRTREVGMRKVLGADRATLRRHYIGEAIATALIASVVGLALAELAIPMVNAATGLTLSIRYAGVDGVLLPLITLAIGIGVVAGLYPASILSRVPAAAVLASARSSGGGRTGARIREMLVTFQFVVTIALIIGTMVLAAQTSHIRNADVGYDRQQLLLVRSFGSDDLDTAQRANILHRFATLPGIEGVSAGSSVPGIGLYQTAINIPVPGVAGDGPEVEKYEAMPGFFRLLGARLIAGRLFDEHRPGDFEPVVPKGQMISLPTNIVVNRSAAKALHFASPEAAVGKTLGLRTIIGVIDDMRVGSARAAVAPTIYAFVRQQTNEEVMIARYSGDPKAMLAAAEDAWRAEAPAVPFSGQTVVQALGQLSKSDDQMANLFAIGAVLAVAIGCIGLWGLASFTTARRVREIGIRKTLGASSADIVKLLVGQFLRPVLIANLFAWPLAFVAMRTWLAGFDDRIALSPLFFVAATALALAIALVTVLAQSLRASRATPAWALRHE